MGYCQALAPNPLVPNPKKGPWTDIKISWAARGRKWSVPP